MTAPAPRLEIRSRVAIDVEDHARIERGLAPLRNILENFPRAELHLDVREHSRAKDFHVRLELHLPRKTIFTGERGVQLYGAFERCVRKMVHKVEAYKEKLRGVPERRKIQGGTSHEVYPLVEPDAEALERAVAAGDYPRFRHELEVYRTSLSLRVGRLVNRFPELVDRLGTEIAIEEIIDEVFIRAFEHYADRSGDRLGRWLEDWAGPSIEALVERTDEEKENLALLDESAEVF